MSPSRSSKIRHRIHSNNLTMIELANNIAREYLNRIKYVRVLRELLD